MKKLLVFILCLVLVGCSGGTSTKYHTDKGYSYGLDEKGYYKDIKASDYVTLPSLENLSFSKSDVDLSDMDSAIEELTGQIGESVEVNRSAQLGDTVNIDYIGSVDGVEFTSGNTNSAGTEIVLGTGTYIDTFEDQIVDHKAGDKFTVTVTFPDNYGDSTDTEGNTITLSGKEAKFETTLNKVYVKELTPNSIKEAFTGITLEDGSEIKTLEDIQEYYKEVQTNYFKGDYVYNYLLDNSNVTEVPDSLVEIEKNKVYTYFYNSLQEGQTIDDAMSNYGYSSFDEYYEKENDSIVDGARTNLIIQAVAEGLELELTDDDFIEIAGSGDLLNQYIELYGKEYIAQTLIYNKVIDYLMSKVEVTD